MRAQNTGWAWDRREATCRHDGLGPGKQLGAGEVGGVLRTGDRGSDGSRQASAVWLGQEGLQGETST